MWINSFKFNHKDKNITMVMEIIILAHILKLPLHGSSHETAGISKKNETFHGEQNINDYGTFVVSLMTSYLPLKFNCDYTFRNNP